MLLVCSTSVPADRDQQHGPQSLAPCWQEVQVKTLGASWCDSAAAAPPQGEVPGAWHTSVVNSWATCITFPDGPLMCLCCQCHKKLVGFFFVHVGLQDTFSALQMAASCPLLKQQKISVFKSVTRSSASLLLIIIHWKLQDEAVACCSSFHRPLKLKKNNSQLHFCRLPMWKDVLSGSRNREDTRVSYVQKKNIVPCGHSRCTVVHQGVIMNEFYIL